MDEYCIPLENLIRTLNKIADLVEVDTKDHSRRVKVISVKLGIELGLQGDALTYLGYGADIHDIGKIAINQVVFRQPTKLTKAQYLAVRGHPAFGLEMISYCKVPQIVTQAVGGHHEHWDGSGYPLGLFGKNIPLPSAIVCLADVWESITSNRPYRPAMDKEKAIATMAESRGWFSPEVYEAYILLLSKGEL